MLNNPTLMQSAKSRLRNYTTNDPDSSTKTVRKKKTERTKEGAPTRLKRLNRHIN